jgi:hypothetical protein
MSAVLPRGPLAALTQWVGRVALMLSCACGASAPAGRQAEPTYVPAEIQPAMGESIISKGTRDTSNRYKATVWVNEGRDYCSVKCLSCLTSQA